MKGFFFESVEVLGGSPELGKGNSGWVPSYRLSLFLQGPTIAHWKAYKRILRYIKGT